MQYIRGNSTLGGAADAYMAVRGSEQLVVPDDMRSAILPTRPVDKDGSGSVRIIFPRKAHSNTNGDTGAYAKRDITNGYPQGCSNTRTKGDSNPQVVLWFLILCGHGCTLISMFTGSPRTERNGYYDPTSRPQHPPGSASPPVLLRSVQAPAALYYPQIHRVCRPLPTGPRYGRRGYSPASVCVV